MPITPERHPGPMIEDDEVILKDNAAGDPTEEGSIRKVAGSFRMRDKDGVFDPRSGGGISEAQHEALDTLVHEVDETSFEEYIYDGSKVTDVVVWETSAKLKRIRDEHYSYTGSRVDSVVTRQYDAAGAVKMTVTETYNYSGSRVTSIDRVKS